MRIGSHLKPVAVLTLTCLVWSAILAAVHEITREGIEAAEKAEMDAALSEIFPGARFVEENGYFMCLENEKIVGYAMVVEGRGYGGRMKVLVGLGTDNRVAGVRVFAHNETLGIGSRVAEGRFLIQFVGKTEEELFLREDGGKIDAITGATVSSRGLVSAVRSGVKGIMERIR